MSMPKFTAESSLNSAGSYQEATEWSPADGGNRQRVIPQQDGCRRGSWCCQYAWGGGRSCHRCSVRTFWGACALPQFLECARYGKVPAYCG